MSILTEEDIVIAKLNLSGEKIRVGINTGDVFILAYGQSEPTYMSVTECNMLIAALKAAKADIKEQR